MAKANSSKITKNSAKLNIAPQQLKKDGAILGGQANHNLFLMKNGLPPLTPALPGSAQALLNALNPQNKKPKK